MPREKENDAMIEWLAAHGQPAFYDLMPHLCYLSSAATIYWILEHEACDMATATYAFWLVNPEYAARCIFARNTEAIEENWTLFYIDLILEKWRKGLFVDRGWPVHRPEVLQKEIASYRSLLAQHPDSTDPLDIPEALFEIRGGVRPEIPDDLDFRVNDTLFMLLDDVGGYPDRTYPDD